MASRKELQALIVLAGKIDPSLKAALKKVQGESSKTSTFLDKMGGKLGNTFRKLGKYATIAGLVMTTAFGAVATKGVKLASDLQEVQNVVDVTFGKSAEQINKWSDKALNAYGLSELQAKQFTGTMGAMLKSSGLTGKNLISMSKNLTGLSGDLASFYNISQEDAFIKIRAGMSGEVMPLKSLGINMSVANLRAYALSKGIKKTYKEMSQAEKTALRYSYLISVSKDAQGDFTRTHKSFANQLRLVKTNFDQLVAKIATAFLPMLSKGLLLANKALSFIGSSPKRIKAIQESIDKVVTSGINFGKRVYPVISSTLKGIIPKLSTFGGELSRVFKNNIPFIQSFIKNGLIPFGNAAVSLGKEVLSALSPVFGIAIKLLPAIKPIAMGVVKIGTKIVNVSASIVSEMNKLGLSKKMVLAFAAGFAIFKTTKMIINAYRMVKAYALLKKAKIVDAAQTLYLRGLYIKDALIRAKDTLTIWRQTIATKAQAAATKIAAGAQWLFNAAMNANPIILIISGVVALAAGFVLLYKKCETFRNIVNKTWEIVKTGAKLAKDAIVMWFGFTVNFWKGAFNTIGSIAGSVFGEVRIIAAGTANVIKSVFGGAASAVKGIWSGITGVVKGTVNVLIGAMNFLISGLNKIHFSIPKWVPKVGGKGFGIHIAQMPTFAKGGLATRASIFGEAGPEMAIPIKYKDPRSINLVNKTARMIGANESGNTSGITINYNPVIYGDNPSKVEPILNQHKEELRAILEDILFEKGRVSFG